MKEFIIKKPTAMRGYPIHRAVAALAQGAPHTWRDNGDTLTIRTTAPIDAVGVKLPATQVGELRLFNLRASVSSKVRGRHIYQRKVTMWPGRPGWASRGCATASRSLSSIAPAT